MPPENAKNKFSVLSSFIMMIGDEGAVLVQIHKGRVIRRLFAQSPEPAHMRSLDDALANSPNSPVTILFDIMDQSYVRQTLPPVSSFSVGKIINRRLTKDFSPDDIKGYMVLDRDKTGRKDWNYMMVSVANNAVIQKWINFVTERANPFRGMGLLPLEAQNFMSAIENNFMKGKGKDTKSREWQILVSHHKIGGFRQIVMRNGRLVFTRMAQPFGDSSPGVIAGNIEQEMINTLEYLKRLGLQDTSAISITIICSDEIKQILDPHNIKAGEHHFLTPYEASRLLSLNDAAQEGDHFGDIVISAFIGRQRRIMLPLNTAYTRKLMNWSMCIKIAKIAGISCALAIMAWSAANISSVISVKSDVDALENKHHALNEDLSKIKSRADTLPKNMKLYGDIMMLSQLLDKKQYDIIEFINNLSNGVNNYALATSVHWSMADPIAVTKNTDKRQIQADLELKLIAPPDSNPKMVEMLQAIQANVKKNLPLFNISYQDAPGMGADTKELKTIISENGDANDDLSRPKIDVVKMIINGPSADKPLSKTR